MHIRFVTDHKVQQHDGKGPEYKAGEVHDFTGFVAETYGRKYIRRGYAVEEPAVTVETQPAAVAPEVEAPPSLPPAATETPAEPPPNAPAPTRQERRRRFRSS